MIMCDWSLYNDDRVRQRLLAVSELLFPQLQNSSYLSKFPLSIMKLMLSRCEIHLKSEVEIACVALKWLSLQVDFMTLKTFFKNFNINDVCNIFSTIRSVFLTIEELKKIEEKAYEINFSEEVIHAINYQLNSVRNQRCCIIKDHQISTMKRCGVPKEEKYYIQATPINFCHVNTKYFFKQKFIKKIFFRDNKDPTGLNYEINDDDVTFN